MPNTENWRPRMSRVQRKKQKKKKRILSIFIMLIIIIVAPTSYFAWEYYSSFQNAKKASGMNAKDIEFAGDEFKGTMNVLLVGVDTREDGEEANSDSIMIAQYDTDTKKPKLVSILRDIYLDIPGYEDKQKINAAYALGGIDLLRQTLKEAFDIEIHYYAIVDFNGFVKAIDQAFPKGIEIDVKQRMSEGIWQTIEPGLQNLNGKQLLGYARFRHDKQNDFGRAERQQEVIQAVTDELVSVNGVLKLPSIIGSIQPYVLTNIENTKILSVLTSLLSNDNNSIEKLVIPTKNEYEDLRVEINGVEQLVLDINMETNRAAIKSFLEDESSSGNEESSDKDTEKSN